MGVCGLSYEDFSLLTPAEFSAVSRARAEHEESWMRDGWERARIVGTLSVSPWSKGRLEPSKVLPLPWDGQAARREERTPIPSKAEARANFEALMARIKRKVKA